MIDAAQHVHRHVPGQGSHTVKVVKNSRAVNFEVSVNRPVRDGETDAEARAAVLDSLGELISDIERRWPQAAISAPADAGAAE